MITCAKLLQYSLYGTRDAAQNWEEELASTIDTQRSRVDERVRVPMRVTRLHGDDITIGGERSAVEFLIKMTPRKYAIKKQVICEDADLEKIG